MNEKKVELIYIDGFWVNTNHHLFRGWAKIGQKGYNKWDSSNFSMSFMWGVSKHKVYGLYGSKSTITSVDIRIYIKDLVEMRNSVDDY